MNAYSGRRPDLTIFLGVVILGWSSIFGVCKLVEYRPKYNVNIAMPDFWLS